MDEKKQNNKEKKKEESERGVKKKTIDQIYQIDGSSYIDESFDYHK